MDFNLNRLIINYLLFGRVSTAIICGLCFFCRMPGIIARKTQ
jgi:hypothetical protein